MDMQETGITKAQRPGTGQRHSPQAFAGMPPYSKKKASIQTPKLFIGRISRHEWRRVRHDHMVAVPRHAQMMPSTPQNFPKTGRAVQPVSYTHLTLPTILRV